MVVVVQLTQWGSGGYERGLKQGHGLWRGGRYGSTVEIIVSKVTVEKTNLSYIS